MNNYNIVYSDEYLAHHGILGQKWGVRRYQNADGSLTAAGAKRYNTVSSKTTRLENKVSKLEAKKKSDVDSFNSITEDLKYKNGKVFYSVEDAKRDQKATAEAYDKKLNKLNSKLNASRTKDNINNYVKENYDKYKSNALEKAKSYSNGEKTCNTLIFGPFGNTNVARASEAGVSKGTMYVNTLLFGTVGSILATDSAVKSMLKEEAVKKYK